MLSLKTVGPVMQMKRRSRGPPIVRTSSHHAFHFGMPAMVRRNSNSTVPLRSQLPLGAREWAGTDLID